MTLSDARKSNWIAYLVAGAFFMENLDGTVIATALPQMAHSFGVSAVDMNVGMSAYMLTLAIFIPASGWVADRFGARTVFATAVAIFTLASLLCAISEGLVSFTLARILQGAAGAMMVPVGRLVVLRNTSKAELMRAIATLTWPALSAPILGPPLGGFITTYASWHWIFLLNLPLGIAALALSFWLIPNDRSLMRPTFDWIGFVLTSLACAGLMYGLDLVGQTETKWLVGAGILAASVVFGWAALRHSRHHAHPMPDLWGLSVQTFAVTMRGGSLFRTAVSAVPFLLPLMLQIGFGLDPFQAGLYVLALFAGNLGMKPGTSWVLRTFGFRTTLIGNGIFFILTMFACAFLTPETPPAILVVVFVLSGAARSMQYTAINTIAFVDIPQEKMAGANTLFSLVQQITFGLGIALGAIALRLSDMFATTETATLTLSDFHTAFLIIGGVAILGLVDSFALPHDAGAIVSKHRRRESATAAPRS
ncbi:MFS transporter [Kaistia dalseonensis]|uniref:EmrB/QacA subfamily drug resistance transporter n=1 Tax=Kaistia dalseonensis TaxID=410840 RepID=A0ABU0H8P7_9HYPH|nr:MFS transporter [Kaistia dalseonensis]MCX5495293.1 MFS transporter [Kaistia dalseonensis]MDQ0437879.1 EmrB/QacA subfamily drug resistance transporter [Kaistia dalseonensis]